MSIAGGKDKKQVSHHQPQLEDIYQKENKSQETQGQTTATSNPSMPESGSIEDCPELFRKHRLMKLTEYINFHHRNGRFLDQFEFSWHIHAYDRLSQFLPTIT